MAGPQRPCHIFVKPPFSLYGVLFKSRKFIRAFFNFKLRGALMGEKCTLHCWEIMNCDESKKCPAKASPQTPCWEIAAEMNDYREILRICTDCIVHLLKGDNTVLSIKEIQSLMDHKKNCVQARDERLASY